VTRSRPLVVPLVLLSLATTARAADAPAVALKTLEMGQGSPAVVLVHDMGQGRLGWMPVAKLLRTDRRVVLADLPGHGESPMPEPFSLDAAADALAALAARQEGKGAVLVGHRTGGLLALRAAQRHPEAVRGLVVIDAAARPPSDLPDQQKKFMAKAIDENLDALLPMMYAATAKDSAEAATLHAQASLVPAANIKAYMKDLLYADASRELQKLTMPVLFVGTEKSWPAEKDWPTLAKERGYEGTPNLTSRRLAGAGYLVMAEQPDSLAAAIRAVAGPPK
jgi:pimeloyl-ACP methyl ester carboxylesterase